MKIEIQLSEESVRSAIRQLRQIQDNLRWGLEETIDILVKDGEMVANSKYGGMAEAIGYMPDENTGIIAAVGKANLIAEFGAGDATLPPAGMFEDSPDTPVYPGSFSESEEGSGEYAATGKWHWGGAVFTEIEPRMGLYNAKNYIEKNAIDIAKEVIKL